MPDDNVKKGASKLTDARLAVDEIYEAVRAPDTKLVAFFCSPSYDLDAVAVQVRERFGGINVIGCTTAGEIGTAGYLDHSISAFSLSGSEFHVATGRLDRLKNFESATSRTFTRDLMNRIRMAGAKPSARNTFGFLLIDGLSIREESVSSSLYGVLDDVPIFGGSAGDALNFNETLLFHEGEFRSDCAVFSLVSTSRAFTVFKTQHFVESDEKLVVTEAKPERRVVLEINGESAAREYADVVGVELEALSPDVFAAHPVVLSVGGNSYVRSIQKVNEDESLSFYCAIDEGIVLTMAEGQDIVNNLQSKFEEIATQVGKPTLIVGCDCVLRNLELAQKQLKGAVGEMMRDYNVVGFSTYGEQFNAMHVNQTFTGVAIGERGRIRP